MKFHTATGSLYEVHQDTKQIRWTRDGQEKWISFEHIVPSLPKVGSKVIILSDKNIMTSRVVKVEE